MTNSKFEIRYAERALKQLNKLDPETRRRIAGATKILSAHPFPPKAKRIIGFNYWRIRVGDYRIIYELSESELIILVVRVGHRKNVYDQLKKLKS